MFAISFRRQFDPQRRIFGNFLAEIADQLREGEHDRYHRDLNPCEQTFASAPW